MFTSIRFSILLLFITLFPHCASSKDIPTDLAEWQDWVSYKQDYYSCPHLSGQSYDKKLNHLCAWPSTLQMDVSKKKMVFSQKWSLQDEGKIPLPGNINHWPQNVKVNNTKAIVLKVKNKPFVQLEKGNYSITGLIPWNKQPESIEIPSQVALVDLKVNNKKIEFIKRKNNKIWLGSVKQVEKPKANFVKLWVNRLIKDGHPMMMTMALDLDIGGSAREEVLTQLNLNKYQLTSITSELNTQVDSQGNLKVQLKPGSYEIRLKFKIHNFPNEFTFDEKGKYWPKQEIWVYKNNERLRSTQIIDASAIDSEQGFVNEWRSLPHYVVNQNETFKLKEGHRGISHSSDRLSLNRQMWLSFDNEAYYFFDTIKGSKSKDWRMNTLPDYQLTQLKNHDKNRLITVTKNEQNQSITGVEVRTPNINIYAGGEVRANKMHHASGWDINFATTNVNLSIPPGRKLIAINGADSSHGDWLGQWDLIDLFFVLIICAMTYKFLGITASIFSVVTLTIGYHESHMPTFLWLNLIAAISITDKITNPNWLKGFIIYKWISVVLLLLTLLPFIAQQIRFTLYPQLELSQLISPSYEDSLAMKSNSSNAEIFALRDEELMPETPVRKRFETTAIEQGKLKKKNTVIVTGSRIKRTDLDNSYEQGAIIQAGKGKPSWNWKQASYAWNGPVEGDEQVSLYILTTNWVRLLRMTMIVFSILWLISILNKGLDIQSRMKKLLDGDSKDKLAKTASISLAILLTFSSFGFNEKAIANEYPSDPLLIKLHNRLYPTPTCSPNCVSVSKANMTIDGQAIKLELLYQSGAKIASMLPSSDDWKIESISVNGIREKSLWKNRAGNWIALKEGISKVKILARLKVKSDLAINFPEKPLRLTHSIKGWELSGLNQNKITGNSLQLTRLEPKVKIDAQGRKEKIDQPLEQSIQDLFSLNRKFQFGTQWTLTNELQRVAPLKGSLTTKIPLLSFEKPIQNTEKVKNGEIYIVLPNNTYSTRWDSILDSRTINKDSSKSFELIAMDEPSISESWQLLVFPNWNIKINGIPAVKPNSLDANDYWIYQYYPRAGEKIEFTISKPLAISGESVAISRVAQDFSISKRKTNNRVEFDYHATRAEPLILNIGKNEIKEVKQDGVKLNLTKVNDVISINLKPGNHSINLWLEDARPIEFKQILNTLSIGKDFSNLTNKVNIPENRWLIMASGVGYGPAILYWGELIFFALLAVGLSRLKFSPLNYWQWLILGLGMSTFSWPALALVSIWILASQWKRDNKELIEKYFVISNWLTVVSSVIAVLALVAAVPYGLLQSPDMGVAGNGSYGNQLVWFLDQGKDSLGEIILYTLPLWVYKILMLLWATWLSFSLIKWLGWILTDLTGAKFKTEKSIAKN